MTRARYAEVLRRLAANDVELIVVGMMAGVLRGAPLLPADLDLVHRRSADNVSLPVLRATLAETLRRS